MGKLHLPGTIVQDFKLVELAGDGTQSNVYLAVRENIHYWLVQIEDKNWEPDVRAARVERFELETERWVALPTSGTSVVNLASWVDHLETPFIGWRWALLARNVGSLHEHATVMQRSHALSFERLRFTEQGELMFAQAEAEDTNEYIFPPPEGLEKLTPAGDVYSLAAALNALLGKPIPFGIQNVLTHARLPEPRKRYKNAIEFGEELAEVLPEPNRVRAPRPPSRLPRNLILFGGGVAALCVGIFALLVFFNFGKEIPVATPEPRATQAVTKFTLEIVGWTMDAQCNATVQVRVLDGGKPLGAIELLQFLVRAEAQSIELVHVAKNAEPAGYTLTFNNGAFCLHGGNIRVTAQTVGKQALNVLWYYPNKAGEGGSFSGIGVGSRQIITRGFPRLRLYFGLTNKRGRPFRIGGALRVVLYQDGIEIPSFRFAAVNPDTDPLTAALVLDTSGSMKGEPLARAQQAAIAFVEKLNPQERVCIYRFSTEVEQLHECDTDHAAAIRALNGLTAVGNTSLYDALVKVSEIHAARAERQAIIVLSDGDDTTSKATLEQALTQSERTNVPIYTIGLLNKDLQPDILRQLAERNGGSYLESPSPDALAGLYESIREALATQFFVEFDSLSPERKRGTIKVQISNGTEQIEIERGFVVE